MQSVVTAFLARVRAFARSVLDGGLPMTAADKFAACLAFTFVEEGGFSDNPQDPGGATNMGITEAELEKWRDEPVSVADVRNLSRAEAEAIYRRDYWNTVQGDALPAGVDLMVWDFGVNAGPKRSAEMLQASVHVVQDGAIGPITLAATHAANPFALIADLADRHDAFYRSRPDFPTFGHDWLGRLDRCRKAANAMVTASVAPVS